MRLNPLLPLLSLLTLTAASPQTTTITLRIAPSHALLPNPNALAPATHATLSSLHKAKSAPLTVANTFVFGNVSAGSYLVDVHCATHAFAPLRIDVVPSEIEADGRLRVQAWETYRGNDWDNKGEAVPVGEAGLEVRVVGGKGYFMERSKFSVLSILKNPMILLGLVSMGIFLGMPYLVDNMDPEMKAEWEERQKTNPMNSIMGATTGGSGVGNFDVAGFLAGSSKKDEAGSGSGSGSGSGAVASSGKGESRKKR
ncbi:hypothetical protein B0H67DRAFT_522440 [Lasiosphaeris hirsuta]|uniref:ER membrane protein complex subunit 7 beta-sandwich domain-containing protein n=1 Tax=Lasiosphaeris hirsuta TaxID=260670 RepID=A0AA40DKV6_9PEZI|nr:hypothetical protein B0H67DRAFT_522440 [Lasiosphaeris hirsuta]